MGVSFFLGALETPGRQGQLWVRKDPLGGWEAREEAEVRDQAGKDEDRGLRYGNR